MNAVINRLTHYVVNPLIYILFAVALLLFVWGVYDLYIAKGGEKDRSQGAQHIMYGIIGMAIMIGTFALMHFVINSLNVFFGTPNPTDPGHIEPPATIL